MALPSRSPLFDLEHDLFGKPVSTFPDHALTAGSIANNSGFRPVARPIRLRHRANDPILSKQPVPTKSGKQGGNAMSSSRTISANGIEMFMREQGQGPLVVLCH